MDFLPFDELGWIGSKKMDPWPSLRHRAPLLIGACYLAKITSISNVYFAGCINLFTYFQYTFAVARRFRSALQEVVGRQQLFNLWFLVSGGYLRVASGISNICGFSEIPGIDANKVINV